MRLPLLVAQSLPNTYQRLEALHGGRIARRWSLEIRSYQQGGFQQSQDPTSSALSESTAAEPPGARGHARMWQLHTSEFPDLLFVLVELPSAGNNAPPVRTLFTASASLTQLMMKANLPRPLGAPGAETGAAGGEGSGRGGTGAAGSGSGSGSGSTSGAGGTRGLESYAGGALGPGAWQQRGAPISAEGVVMELPGGSAGVRSLVQPPTQGNGFAPRAERSGLGIHNGGAKDHKEWTVRIGQLSIGGSRSSGCVAEVSRARGARSDGRYFR